MYMRLFIFFVNTFLFRVTYVVISCLVLFYLFFPCLCIWCLSGLTFSYSSSYLDFFSCLSWIVLSMLSSLLFSSLHLSYYRLYHTFPQNIITITKYHLRRSSLVSFLIISPYFLRCLYVRQEASHVSFLEKTIP